MTEVLGILGILVGLLMLPISVRDLRRALAAKHAFEQKLLQQAKASAEVRQALIQIASLAPRTGTNLSQALYETDALNELTSAVDTAVLELSADHQSVVKKSLARPRAAYLDDVVQHVTRDLTTAGHSSPYSTSAV